ncbi:HEAT repeat domain-containing protein, partial [Streptomyces olivaceus]
ETLQLLLDRVVNDPAMICRRAALIAVGSQWLDQMQVFDLLRDRAMNDTEELVRQSAVQLLGDHWSSIPEVRDINLEVMRKDPDMMPRLFALIRLIRWTGEPDVRDLLRSSITSDTDAVIRSLSLAFFSDWNDAENMSEVFALAQDRAANDPEELMRESALILSLRSDDENANRALARDRSVNDPHEAVRATAIDCLAGYWLNDPETRVMLKERAIEDASELVRETALGLLVREWSDSADVSSLLWRRAIEDPSLNVRLYSLQLYIFLTEEMPNEKAMSELSVAPDNSLWLSILLSMAYAYPRNTGLAEIIHESAQMGCETEVNETTRLALAVVEDLAHLPVSFNGN